MKHTPAIMIAVVTLSLAALSCQTLSRISALQTPPAAPILVATQAVTVVPPAQVVAPNVIDLTASQDTLVKLYKTTSPGVVSIRVLTGTGAAQGSGFVYDRDGHIITNYHVVEGETDLEVGFSDGNKLRGEVIGKDIDSDLAVIRVDAPADQLHPLPLGDSSQVQVGQTVVAIGNPFGLEGTMTLGILSGLGRTVESQHTTDSGTFSTGDILQTDASINPGNSGGPLLNLDGEVIGVNESIRTTAFNSEGQPVNSGVGFAISINIIKRVVPFLIKEGKYDYPYLGIYSLSNLTLTTVEALGLPQTTGVYVNEVTPNGPADRAGVHGGSRDTDIRNVRAGGDLIVGVDGHPVLAYNDLIGYVVREKSPGDTISLTILRDGKQIDLKLTLDKRPNE